jgi:myo-inositol-1(or 4)-monophosphatase
VRVTDLELALAAADAGATVLRAKYGAVLVRFDKSPTDFATDADLEAESAIMDVLRSARPADGFVGEERGRGGAAESHRTWLVDPLCGTLNYAARTPLAAVNVVLREGDRITVAVSGDPFAAELFWTDGAGAYVRRVGADEALTPSADSRLVDVNLDVPQPSVTARMLSTAAFAGSFGPRVLSTTLAVAWVAAGRRAAYVTEGDVRDSVHFASGIALCQAAGCVVTGLRGQPLHTGVGGLLVAADAATHARLVSIIDSVGQD